MCLRVGVCVCGVYGVCGVVSVLFVVCDNFLRLCSNNNQQMVKTFVVGYFSALVLTSHHSCCSNIYWVPFKNVLLVCDTLMQANFSYQCRQTLLGANIYNSHNYQKNGLGLSMNIM